VLYLSLYFIGEICKPCHLIELDDHKDETDNDWIISFEQFEAALNAETCLVTWLESNNNNTKTLETRINNYHQDIQR
jgi:hypothetical protein